MQMRVATNAAAKASCTTLIATPSLRPDWRRNQRRLRAIEEISPVISQPKAKGRARCVPQMIEAVMNPM